MEASFPHTTPTLTGIKLKSPLNLDQFKYTAETNSTKSPLSLCLFIQFIVHYLNYYNLIKCAQSSD